MIAIKTLTIKIYCLGFLVCFIQNKATAQINWLEWNAKSFEQAKSQDKLILVDIGMEGCTACRLQDEITYANTDVIAKVNEHFVAIQVDCQARPDIGEKYSDWSWPATIFLSPQGEQVHAIAGNRFPSRFINILDDLILRKNTGDLTPDPNRPYSYPAIPANTEISKMRDVVRNQLDGFYNDETGGWGTRMKNNQRSGSIEQLFVRLRAEDDSLMYERAIKTLDGMLHQIDPVWGGMFVASVGDWSNIVPEKRIATQSTALTGFAYGYKLTGNPTYLQAIKDIDKYVSRFLTSPNGMFYTSQEDDAPGLPDSVSARDYYRLNNEKERLQFGIPPIDHAIYIDLNARLISAYTKVFECTGNALYLEKAEKATLSILQRSKNEEGWMHQKAPSDDNFKKDQRIRKLPEQPYCFLSPQAFFGKALLDLYKVTNDSIYLVSAITLENAMSNKLMDSQLGGYFSLDSNFTTSNSEKRKPIELNAMAALFLYQLGIYVKDSSLVVKSKKTVSAIFDENNIKREGPVIGFTSYSLEMLAAGYVEYAIVVRQREEYFADELYSEVLEVFEPRKIPRFEISTRFPYKNRPTLYICNERLCSPPVVLKSEVVIKSNMFVNQLHALQSN